MKHGKGVHTTKHHKYIEEWNEGQLIDRKGDNLSCPSHENTEQELLTNKIDKSPGK